MRFGAIIIGIGVGVALAAPVRADDAPPPEAGFSDLIGWIDRNLDAAAAASSAPQPPPALGEGPVSRALDWLRGPTEAPPSPDVAPPPAPPTPAQEATRPAAAAPVAPVSAVAPMSAGGAPIDLVGDDDARQTAGRPESGLLLPLN
ncbi:exported hypothetical protein [uncultured Alphaproteobacteria bacterium]|uniref:Uncharacterized protein n=1 Tax=uncultured Alphaproteobacteria bacterium TaxID=91750 RepID=A0A212IYI8_9PROT|nr:exported hypothetical protein [uncultured Alphaproteobacteria bacterium]